MKTEDIQFNFHTTCPVWMLNIIEMKPHNCSAIYGAATQNWAYSS